MSNPFDRHLNTIANRITVRDEDRQSFTKDFDFIRDYIFQIMRAYDSDFDKICKGHSLFGSYSNNVRICYPNEFDVHILLSFPFSRYIQVDEDEDRPGFVNLDFTHVISELENTNGYDDVYDLLNDNLVDWENQLLRRSNLQRWIFGILENALDYYGRKIRGPTGILYELEYSKRGLAHTIYAHDRSLRSGNDHSISIDFVPAIMFGRTEWMSFQKSPRLRNKCDRWYAVPKPIDGPKETRKYAFMICCPKAEHDLLLGRQNLKVVLRLLKSLRDAYDLPRLKSYFLTTVFLWEILEKSNDFWQQPLSDLLIHMLEVLYDYFLDAFLPFFWNNELNLLDIFDDYEIWSYGEELRRAYNTLITYVHQPNLSFGRTLTHFKIRERR